MQEIPFRVFAVVVLFHGLVFAPLLRFRVPDIRPILLDRAGAAAEDEVPPLVQHAALGADPVDDGVVGVPDVLEPVPAELDLEGEGGGVDDDRPGDDAVEEPGEVLRVLRVGLLPAGLARVVVVLPFHPGDLPPDPKEPEDRRVAGPVVDRDIVGLCPSRRLVEDVLALVPHVVNRTLRLNPEAQDKPLVPEARVLRL